jgi:hypothetical protein
VKGTLKAFSSEFKTSTSRGCCPALSAAAYRACRQSKGRARYKAGTRLQHVGRVRLARHALAEAKVRNFRDGAAVRERIRDAPVLAFVKLQSKLPFALAIKSPCT